MSDKKLRKGSRKLKELIAGKIEKAMRRPVKWAQECKRCGYKWKSRRARPIFCSRCKTKAWNKGVEDAPLRRPRKRYWLGGKRGKTVAADLSAKGTLVIRRAGRKGYMSAKMDAKRRRDAEVKRKKRAAAILARRSVRGLA